MFDTPKGEMIFRKEDHQALQSMYHFKVRVDPSPRLGRARSRQRDEDRRHADPDPQQAVRKMSREGDAAEPLLPLAGERRREAAG